MSGPCVGALVLASCLALAALGGTSASYVSGGDVLYVEVEETPRVRWLVDDKENEIEDNGVGRVKRSYYQSAHVNTFFNNFQPESCQHKLQKLCDIQDKKLDDLLFLECIQTLKVRLCTFLLPYPLFRSPAISPAFYQRYPIALILYPAHYNTLL
jgi:hypothetical protein